MQKIGLETVPHNAAAADHPSLPDLDNEHSWLLVGARVLVKDRSSISGTLAGVVQFVGSTDFASGLWVGVALDSPRGKNNGKVLGRTYFSCLPRYGLFVRPSQVTLLTPAPPATVRAEPEISLPTPPPASRNTPPAPVHVRSLKLLKPVNAPTTKSGVPKIVNPAPNSPSVSSAKLQPPISPVTLAVLVKKKVARMMDLLNQQLEMVEMLESRLNPEVDTDSVFSVNPVVSLTDEEKIELLAHLYSLCKKEVQISSDVLRRIDSVSSSTNES